MKEIEEVELQKLPVSNPRIHVIRHPPTRIIHALCAPTHYCGPMLSVLLDVTSRYCGL